MSGFLQKGEPAPVRVVRNKAGFPGVVTCEHAANRVPRVLKKKLGVSRAALAEHTGLDIGAEDVSLLVAKKLGMPAVIPAYSRLVVDLNRDTRMESCMPRRSDPLPWGVIDIPGNTSMSKAERKARLDALFHPFQDAVKAEVDCFVKAGKKPLVLSIHSFTPVMEGRQRPWHVGVMWDKEAKLSRALIANLRRQNPGIVVGDNEPYSLKSPRMRGAVVRRHGERRGLPHVLVEFRNDLIRTPAGVAKWSNIFIRALRPLLEA